MKIFLASILNFVLFQCQLCIYNKILVKNFFFIGPLWGELRLFRVVLRLRGMKNIFKIGQNFLYLKSNMTLKYLLIIDFPKFDPLTAAEMPFWGNLGPKCQNLFPLV